MPAVVDSGASWHLEAVVGRGSTFQNSWGNAGFVDFIGSERELARGFSWSPMASVGAVEGSKIFGDRDKTVWFAGGGARLNVWRGFFASFEIGAVSAQTPVFSSTYQFATSVGWRWEHLVLTARHISNGGLKDPNYGETMYMVGVSF